MTDTDDDTRPDPAKRLQLARETAGFSSGRQAAIRFGWSEFTYAQHESGIRGITRVAGKYAKAFRVSEAWLLTGEGEGPGSRSSLINELRDLFLALPTDQDREDVLKLIRVYTLGANAKQGDLDMEPRK